VSTEPSWLHPEAIKEARAAREWYFVWNADAGDAFMAELDAAIERIEKFPSADTWTRRTGIMLTLYITKFAMRRTSFPRAPARG